MADQRSYDLATTHTVWDDSVYFNVDKSGFARSKKYLASALKTHLKVGDQQYTEDNYVTDDETLTNSIDQLDMALKALSDTVTAYTGINFVQVSLTTGQVDALGTYFTLMATPVAATTAYQIIDIKWCVNPTTQLDVGTQDLEVYFEDETNYLGIIRNASVESASRLVRGIQIQGEHDVGIAKQLRCKLSGDANPSSGAATMNFYIVYKEITIPAAIV